MNKKIADKFFKNLIKGAKFYENYDLLINLYSSFYKKNEIEKLLFNKPIKFYRGTNFLILEKDIHQIWNEKQEIIDFQNFKELAIFIRNEEELSQFKVFLDEELNTKPSEDIEFQNNDIIDSLNHILTSNFENIEKDEIDKVVNIITDTTQKTLIEAGKKVYDILEKFNLTQRLLTELFKVRKDLKIDKNTFVMKNYKG